MFTAFPTGSASAASIASFPPSAAIRADGADADWLEVRTRYLDRGDRGGDGAANPLLALASDDSALYLEWKPGDRSGSVPAELCLDADGNAATGRAGAEVCLDVGDPGKESGPTAVRVTRYAAGGEIRSGKTAGRRASVLPGRSRLVECAIPIKALGLSPGASFRFILRFGKTARYLKGFKTLASTRMRYRLSSAMTLDGLEDGWAGVGDAWADPAAQAAPPAAPVPPQKDLRAFKIARDTANLYLYFRTWGAWKDSGAPTLTFTLQATGDSAAHPLATRTVKGARPGGEPLGDWSESAIPLGDLGLKPGDRFRFSACLGKEECLQGVADAGASPLYFPSRTVYLGAQMFGLHPETLDSLLDAYAAILMGGEIFRAGRYFNVQLAVHGEQGSDMASAMPGRGRYDFRTLSAVLGIFRAHGIAYFPLIEYHYLPPWFQAAHDSLYGQTRPVGRGGRTMPQGNTFMPVIPDAPGYRVWAVDFTREAVKAMQPYLGKTVPMVFTGNEVFYPGSRSESYSFDTNFTLKSWRAFRKDAKAEFPGSATPEFCRFRSERLAGLLADWTRAGSEAAEGAVPVSTKLVPYAFLSGEFRGNGYYPGVFDYLDQGAYQAIAVDAYPPEGRYLQPAYRLGKPMVLAEYSHGSEGRTDPYKSPSRGEIAGWLESAVKNQGMEGAFFYSWNSSLPKERILPEQIAGIQGAVGRILDLERPLARTRLIRGLLPVDPSILGGEMPMAHPDVMAHLNGWALAASAIQAAHPGLAFELGRLSGNLAPDVIIRCLSGDTVLTPAEARFGKTIYMLREAGTRVRIGTHTIATKGARGNAGKSACRWADTSKGRASDAVLMDWTPSWFQGSKYLATDLPSVRQDTAMGVRVLAESGDGIVALQVGKGGIFMSSDLFWHIGNSRGDPGSIRLLDDLILRLLED